MNPVDLVPRLIAISFVFLIGLPGSGCSPSPAPREDAAQVSDSDSGEIRTTEPTEPPERSGRINSPPQSAGVDEIGTLPGHVALTAPRHRLPNDRPDLNPERLRVAGIHRLESGRLILLTDRSPDGLEDLPQLADELFDYLQQVCGPLRPAADDTAFQVTGCLMVDEARFSLAGLIPPKVVGMRHGQQLGYSFWIRDQPDDYYLRHLLLHEFVHCYMTCETGLGDIPPAWFMEGAAEVFATHQSNRSATVFSVIPHEHRGFEGWGRISEIRRRLQESTVKTAFRRIIPTLDEVLEPSESLQHDDGRYAYWWAVCWMLDNHPDFMDDWTKLCRTRGRMAFAERMAALKSRAKNRLRSDWLLFMDCLCEGFDASRSFAAWRKHRFKSESELALLATAGWQDTGHWLHEGVICDIRCDGSCVLAKTTVPWVAEPQGITLNYNQSRPLGEVVALIVDPENGRVSHRIPIGRSRRLIAPISGRLWLQINDSAAQRADNSGALTVKIHING